MRYYIYILASKKNGTLYVGVTNNLIKRVNEHKLGLYEGFSKKYNIKRFVYYELINDIFTAIRIEKQIKKWNRNWKITMIEKSNPDWIDLYDMLI
jgi:putative endonuclease